MFLLATDISCLLIFVLSTMVHVTHYSIAGFSIWICVISKTSLTDGYIYFGLTDLYCYFVHFFCNLLTGV